MAATQAQIEAGAQALENYVESIDGFEAYFISQSTYEQGAQIILNAADVTTAGAALYADISNAGYANDVTPDQCNAAAAAVLAAVTQA